MLKKLTILCLFVAFRAGATCTDVMEGYKVHPETKWLTIEQLAKDLHGKAPMTVGFDIDDTVLFSSPGFYYWGKRFEKLDQNYFSNYDFWHAINNGSDEYNMPKRIGKKLIEFHKGRGDRILFITARWKTKVESVTKLLRETFSLPMEHRVIFTGSKVKKKLSKLTPILKNNVKIFYGDADNDILSAQGAKIRGIRIMRAPNSDDQPLPLVGGLGEEVLRDSMF